MPKAVRRATDPRKKQERRDRAAGMNPPIMTDRKFSAKQCRRCEARFIPNSGAQKYCQPCREARYLELAETNGAKRNERTRTTAETVERPGPWCEAQRAGGNMGICYMPAGWGTNHVGIGRCRLHGGSSPAHGVAAAKARLRAAMLENPTYGAPRDIDPFTAIQEELARTAGHVEWLRMKIVELGLDPTDPGTPFETKSVGERKALTQSTLQGINPSVWISMYQAERAHLIRVCKDAVAMGVAERQVKILEDQGRMLATVIQAIFNHPDLQLNARQRTLLPEITRGELLKVSVVNTTAEETHALPERQATQVDVGEQAEDS